MSILDQNELWKQRRKIYNFINQNISKYGEEVSKNMIYSLRMLISDDSHEYIDDIIEPELMQLFSKYGVIKKAQDPYLKMYDLLEKSGFLNSDCCEVSAGTYPRLSELVAKSLKETNHKLIIYDPKIILSSLGEKVIIKKELFTHQTDISNVETIYGMYPCEATTTIVEKGLKENKNILIAFCQCDHSTPKYPRGEEFCWALDVCKKIKNEHGSEIEMFYLSEPPKEEFPLILKRSKRP